MANNPVARTFFIRYKDQGLPLAIMSVFVDAKTQVQHDMIVQRIELQKMVTAALLSQQGAEAAEEILDAWCEDIQEEFNVECRGVISVYFDGLSYSTDHDLFKEAMGNG